MYSHGPNITLGERFKRHRPELSTIYQEDKESSRYVRNLVVMRGGGQGVRNYIMRVAGNKLSVSATPIK